MKYGIASALALDLSYVVDNNTRAAGGPSQRTIAVKHTLMLQF